MEVFLNTVSGLAQHPQAVCFVDHQQRTVFLAQVNNTGKVDDIAVHTEDGIHHDQGSSVTSFGQEFGQRVQVIVLKLPEFRA